MKLSTEAVDAIAASHAAMPETRRLISARHRGVPPVGSTVNILYVNWRGELGLRTLVIEHHWHGSTQWHPEMQDLFTAYEPSSGKTRDFAVAGVKSWDAFQ